MIVGWINAVYYSEIQTLLEILLIPKVDSYLPSLNAISSLEVRLIRNWL